jgi:hypothetical protein
LATKFTYKMRSGGKGMWGRGPALYKQNYFKKKYSSGRQTFPPIFWLDVGILAWRGDFNACQSPIIRLYFTQVPLFCIPAYILYTCLNFHETPEF